MMGPVSAFKVLTKAIHISVGLEPVAKTNLS
jgi:hypothetical protein